MTADRRAALQRRILEHPDDDSPRVELAELLDAEGDPRGELIRAQLQIRDHRRKGGDDGIGALDAREKELLAAYGKSWAGPIASMVDRYRFRRGFVEEITCSAERFSADCRKMLSLAPIRHLNLTGVVGHLEVFSSPCLQQIVSLAVSKSKIGDAGAKAIAASTHLSKLRWLGLSFCDIGDGGLEALARSTHLPNLHYLGFNQNRAADPTPRAAGTDFHGTVVDAEHPAAGRELIKRVGRKPWLTIDPLQFRVWPPRRDDI